MKGHDNISAVGHCFKIGVNSQLDWNESKFSLTKPFHKGATSCSVMSPYTVSANKLAHVNWLLLITCKIKDNSYTDSHFPYFCVDVEYL